VREAEKSIKEARAKKNEGRSALERELAAAKHRLLGVEEFDGGDDGDGGFGDGVYGEDAYAELLPGAGGFGLADIEGGSDDEAAAEAEARGRVTGADGKLKLVVDGALVGGGAAGEAEEASGLTRKQRREAARVGARKRPVDPDARLDSEMKQIEKLWEEKASGGKKARTDDSDGSP